MAAPTETVEGLLTRLQESSKSLTQVPYCSGTYALTDKNGGVAYRKTPTGTEAGWLDFFSGALAESDLQGLVQACDPATFGLGGKDVLDPSYRQAWKLDTSQFSAQFDTVRSGLLDIVHDQLLRYENSSRKIDAQLYKLNVYGPGSHFKSHVDTPQSDEMFGSLVIILPTVHVGGDLTLRFANTSWTFESAKLLSKDNSEDANSPPRLAWVAFYSDTEHEIAVVESGYRISLTYNLYYSKEIPAPFPPAIVCPPTEEVGMREALKDLLSSPLVLPDGGGLGFGLTYKYPINPKEYTVRYYQEHSGTNFHTLTGLLKGTDALIRLTCQGLGLECQVKGLYSFTRDTWDETKDAFDFLTDFRVQDANYMDRDEVSLVTWAATADHLRIRRIIDPQLGGAALAKCSEGRDPEPPSIPLLWATDSNNLVPFESVLATYGNEPSVAWVYGKLVLIALVPSYEERAKAMSAPEL